MDRPVTGQTRSKAGPSMSVSSFRPHSLGKSGVMTTSISIELENTSDHDPDIPLPSVEHKISSSSSHKNTSSTSSPVAQDAITRSTSDENDIQEQDDAFRRLRLDSTNTSETPTQQRTSTPSIRISSSAPLTNGLTKNYLTVEFESLHIEPHEDSPMPDASMLRETPSPSPSRRRRSGSGITRETHRIENEEPPPTLFHKAEVQQALSGVKSALSTVVDVLSSSSLHIESGSTIQCLHDQALNLADLQLPSSRIVGLVGDSGVGKSSLINSLLDKVDLARASSSGTACTCAVTEYIFHDRDDFTIRVDYFTLDELKRQFEELLRAYRDHELLPKSSIRKEEDEGSMKKALERKAKLATQTFKAVFEKELQDQPSVLSSMAFDRAVGLMIDWASQLLPRAQGQESFGTIEQCSSRLRELTSELGDHSSGVGFQTRWPFIRKLRVYLNAFILSKGLIIADLPGLRDQNSARKAITERYIRQCHQVFAVARIDRAITDESVKEIFELARCANLSKIDVVCTRSEEIQTREARHDWIAEKAKIEELQSAVDDDTQLVESLKEEIDEFEQDLTILTREEEHDLQQLQQEYRKAEKSKLKNEFELFRLIVELRNTTVSDRLREQYRDHPIAATLRTFCVSNKTYWDYRNKPVATAMPYLALSGIIGLRQYCIGIVADSRLRATIEFINDQVPAFLGSVELWVEAGSGNASAERKQQILDAVSVIQEALDEMMSPRSQINNISRSMVESFMDQVDMRMRQHSTVWAVSAREASIAWHGWHHSSYKAFCSYYGDYSTPARGHHCWNREAMVHMKRDMSGVWTELASDLETAFQQALQAITDGFESVLRIGMPEGATELAVARIPRSVVRTLVDIVYHRKDIVLSGTEDAIEDFRNNLLTLKTNALAHVRTAFLGRYMEEAYHAANMEYGSGSDRRRKGLITEGFGSFRLFNNHRQACKAGFNDLARSLQDQMLKIIRQQVQLIEADLQLLRDENVVLESERDPDFRKRVEAQLKIVRRRADRARKVVEGAQ